MRLAIVIDIDGDIMYVPEDSSVFENYPKPKLFDNMEDAEEECAKSVDKVSSYNDIRPFNLDERNRATERRLKNNGQ